MAHILPDTRLSQLLKKFRVINKIADGSRFCFYSLLVENPHKSYSRVIFTHEFLFCQVPHNENHRIDANNTIENEVFRDFVQKIKNFARLAGVLRQMMTER